jgi:replicative DNA helicase
MINDVSSKTYESEDQHKSKTLPDGFLNIKPSLSLMVDEVERLYQGQSALKGLSTGFKSLDRITRGLQKDDLVIIGARRAMGSTSLILNIAEHVAINLKKKVVIFSGDTNTASEISLRMLSSMGMIVRNKLHTGRLEEEDWVSLIAATNRLKSASIFINQDQFLTVDSMVNYCNQLAEIIDIDLIVLDYVQALRSRCLDLSLDSDDGYTEILSGLKDLSVNLGAPVLTMSYVREQCVLRDYKCPIISDLPAANEFIEYASLIAFLYRDDVYNDDSDKKGIATVIVRDLREGRVKQSGVAELNNELEYCRFGDLDDCEH